MPINPVNFFGPVALPGYVLSPTGGIIRYVHASGAVGLDQLPAGMADIFDTAIDLALQKCRDNRGDQVIVLPGHTESITGAAGLPSMKSGVTILGIGNGDERPTINWTAAASNVALAKNNVRFENLILNFAATAAITVTEAITITGTRNTFAKNSLIFGAAGGTQNATCGIKVSTGAHRTRIEDNEIWSAPDAATTDHFLVSAAVDRFMFRRNYGSGGPAGANGLLRFSAAATNILVDENFLENTLAGANSTAVFVGFAGLTGQFPWNALSVQNNGTAASQGIIVPGNARANQTFTSDEAGKSGALSPAVVAT